MRGVETFRGSRVRFDGGGAVVSVSTSALEGAEDVKLRMEKDIRSFRADLRDCASDRALRSSAMLLDGVEMEIRWRNVEVKLFSASRAEFSADRETLPPSRKADSNITSSITAILRHQKLVNRSLTRC